MPWRALFSASAKLCEIVVAQSIMKPGIGEIDGVQRQQLAGHRDQLGPMLLLSVEFGQAAVRVDVLGVGRDGLLERMARRDRVIVMELDSAQIKPGDGVLGINLDGLGEQLLGLVPFLFAWPFRVLWRRPSARLWAPWRWWR